MKISKNIALELIDKKINQFSGILNRANYKNIHNQEYREVYSDTEALISNLFSKDEAIKFRENVVLTPSGRSDSQKLQSYENHLGECISQLKAYKNIVQDFWGKDKIINWSLLKSKLQMLFNEAKKSWKRIGFIFIFLGVVAGAIDNWQTISEFVNSTLITNYPPNIP